MTTQSVDHAAVDGWTRLPDSATNTTGATMSTATRQASVRDTLDVFQALLAAAQHPGIRDIEPYGPGIGGIEGVKVRFVWGEPTNFLWAYLAGNDLNPDGKPVDRRPTPKPFAENVPWAPVPDPKSETGSRDKWLAVDYVLKLVHDLCEAAQPTPLTGWTPVALQGVGLGHGPSGLAVTTSGGSRLVLRVTIGSGPNRDPEDNPWPDYRIPTEGIHAWKERLQDILRAPATPSTAPTASSVSAS